jgi:hypothetical protein
VTGDAALRLSVCRLPPRPSAPLCSRSLLRLFVALHRLRQCACKHQLRMVSGSGTRQGRPSDADGTIRRARSSVLRVCLFALVFVSEPLSSPCSLFLPFVQAITAAARAACTARPTARAALRPSGHSGGRSFPAAPRPIGATAVAATSRSQTPAPHSQTATRVSRRRQNSDADGAAKARSEEDSARRETPRPHPRSRSG